ncbi:Histidinol phosphatase and related hydrolases of the PHP family [Alloiococcus otitis]|uniref:Polymerase/histidinol phosphatase N-terminal domain-containing protein n=1 Tax=Alloiococcus otitis ATCC 51267 TaxID=883081 RepID=K9ESK7_9LACT|nr:CehA/McbA family metallohydrolase [Alloiococcus otitis]EKU93912.1 hypothetical protein HMPREF9698_00589 [Alloiococcus otitis ATCC 51267]SUU81731.1 Histidinol phosphatase and related hydrolases of the PHP family [Alloiococcus otitis]
MKHSFPVEVHTHTHHSDGIFSPEDLIQAALDFGYRGLIITDHNTSAPYGEMKEKHLLNQEGLLVLRGMEWTTFYGHMLVHDASYDVDWRQAKIDTIDSYMQEVKEAGGLVGIAHPFDMGSPICTGCHWDFQVQDFHLVDYIEVWNSNRPQEKLESQAAYDYWLDKLDQGYQVAASTGRDWHGPDSDQENMGVTYLEVDEASLTEDNFKSALAKGAFYISLGPEVHFQIDTAHQTVHIGDQVSLETIQGGCLDLELCPTSLPALQAFDLRDLQVVVWNNRRQVLVSDTIESLKAPTRIKLDLGEALEAGYLRYEVLGQYRGQDQVKVVIGNPIYIAE